MYLSKLATKYLKAKNVGFRQLEQFNDPFEGALSPVQPSVNAELILKQMGRLHGEDNLQDSVKRMVRFSQQMISEQTIGMNCAALCLTPDPLNPLMWSHYSGLSGMVIGFDVDSEFFRGYNNACPIQFGEVIYLDERPKPMFESENTMPLDSWYRRDFEEGNIERVRAAFLYKHKRWDYEKEVRIVKRLDDNSEDDLRDKAQCSAKRDLYLYDLPDYSIVEVYRVVHPMILYTLKANPGIGGSEGIKKFRDFVVDGLGVKLYAITASLETFEFDIDEIS